LFFSNLGFEDANFSRRCEGGSSPDVDQSSNLDDIFAASFRGKKHANSKLLYFKVRKMQIYWNKLLLCEVRNANTKFYMPL
jgi:hypothetical protein